MNPALILAGILVAANLATGLYAWDADRALRREHDRAAAATLQRDQFEKGLAQCRLDVAERNRILNGMTMLPVVRKQLCAVQGPQSPCCTPAGTCEP